MTQVRKKPLPAGRYWISLSGADVETFDSWCKSNSKRINVERRTVRAANDAILDLPADPVTAFVIFLVLKPTTFPSGQFGFPNDAPPEIKAQEDTVQRPPVPTPGDTLNDFFDSLRQTTGVRLMLVLGLVWAFTQTDRK